MRTATAIFALSVIATSIASAQDVVPFKLGTFEDDGERFVGIVLDDSVVVDIAAADPTNPSSARIGSA